MRHYVLTRSAYGRAWDIEANARRLEFSRRVTIASMSAQTCKDWTWIVAVDLADPLIGERMDAFAASGVHVRFIEVRSGSDRSKAAAEAYKAPWDMLLGPRDETVAMTRLDDDDALADWAVERVQFQAARARERVVLMFPRGIRVWDGCCTVVRHNSNAMQTLVTPPGDDLHVYAYKHRDVRNVARVREADPRIAWVWSRHPDTISGWHSADLPITDRVREMFPAIDWSVFGQATRKPRTPVLTGRFFR